MVKRVVLATILVGIVAVVGSALWTRHQRAVAAEEAAAIAECQEVRATAERERRPDGKLPIDDRALNIRLGACEDAGRF